ncbi:MAG: RNA polymerase factor sigma-54 [Armatimonadetes bacterium]|nr:RNA polymerase factor sigma-54 [Armatimonadota bacterium]
MAQSMGMSTGMEQTLNPKMIAFYELLQQPGFELEQAIESELQDNPALEVTAERLCPACGAHMMAAACRECGYKITKEDEEAADAAREKVLDLAIEASPMEKPVYNGDDDGFDVMARLTATETLTEHLKWQWGMSCSKEHRTIGDQLIGCINDDGYLDTDLETLAEGLDVPLQLMEEVLAEIQTLEPAGVGARTLRECLRLQLVNRDKGPDAETAQLALRLIDDHWQTLARHSYEDIARKLKTSVERVQDGADFIRTELSPYPGRQFHPSWHTGSPHGEGRVRPDVEIKKNEGMEGAYTVEVNESRSLGLRVNSVYRQLWDAMRKDSVAYSSKDREHVQTYLTRAREFIDNLNQRRKTLKLIIEAVAAEQGQFLEQGTHALKPLTRLSVAHKLGLHESTVGRAVSGKYAMLPNGEVIGCEIFFDASLSIKEVIKDLLAEENPRKPYSDEQISMELSKRGIEIARRTVTKYREALKIPPAAQRRRYD